MSPHEHAMSSTITKDLLVMVMAILFLLFLLLLMFFLHARRHRVSANRAALFSRVRFVFAADLDAAPRLGLDPAFIRALPVAAFRSADFKEGVDCAVCLSHLSDGERARLLPRCSHRFHLDCIDMWFHSNSTCPLCRTPVCSGTQPAEIPPSGEVLGDGQSENFNGDAQINQGSSSSAGSSSSPKAERMLVIEIPSGAVDGLRSPNSPLPLSKLPAAEDMKSPVPTRLRSLRRLLSRGSRGIGSLCSPREGDIEQGVVGLLEGGSLSVSKTEIR